MSLDEHARLERERSFHNRRYGEEPRVSQLKYYAAIWHGAAAYTQLVLNRSVGCDVLDYGCGDAGLSLRAARVSSSVVGIDISEVAAAQANEAACAQGLTNTRYAAMNAEALDLPDGAFDLVFGSGIVHHLDLEKAYGEIARVLRPNGTALFWEPLGHNPLINAYRAVTPDARTADEHPLQMKDIRLARKFFGKVAFEPFGLMTLATVPLRRLGVFAPAHRATAWLDRQIFRLPPARRLAWYGLLRFSAPLAGA